VCFREQTCRTSSSTDAGHDELSVPGEEGGVEEDEGDERYEEEITPPLEWISSPPLVAAVLVTTKDDESPGSSRMGVIGALVICFSI